MKKCLVGIFCVGLFLHVMPVQADLIWEPMGDSFYSEYANECEYVNRTYIANGPKGEVTVFESPVSEEVVDVWETGKQVYISYVYEDAKGNLWGIYDNGDVEKSGWVPMEYMALKYDSKAFMEEYAKQLVEEEATIIGGAEQTVNFWQYPGSKELIDVKIGEGELHFSTIFMDEAGHKWGHVGYFRGIKNYWVCVDAPGADFETLYGAEVPVRGVVLEGTEVYIVDGTQYVDTVEDSQNENATGSETQEHTGSVEETSLSEKETEEKSQESQVPFVTGIVTGVGAITGAMLALLKRKFTKNSTKANNGEKSNEKS